MMPTGRAPLWSTSPSTTWPAHLESLQGRGLAPGAIQTVNKGVQLSAITDPDSNKITFIGSFRINY